MSQDSISTSRRRRTARSHRNRPVLVTSTAVEQSEDDVQDTPAVEAPALEVAPAAPATPAPTSMAGRMRRLRSFISTAGKGEPETAPKEVDVAQARLARATRGKVTSSQSAVAKDDKSKVKDDEAMVETKATRSAATSKASPAPARPASPPSPFKPRYILGMGIYLLAANFIGVFEQQLLRSYRLETVLTQFNLFGGIIRISTSTVLFLATLVVLLVILAKFDLIPRNLGAAGGTSPRRSGQSQRGTDSGEEGRGPQPTMRQGVKGADDKLYQEYRANQRREKKR
jgi:hypothetical protein